MSGRWLGFRGKTLGEPLAASSGGFETRKVRLRAPPLPSLPHFVCRGPRRAAAAPWPLFAARPTVPFFCRSVSKQSGEVAAAGAASRGMNWDWFRYRRQPASWCLTRPFFRIIV